MNLVVASATFPSFPKKCMFLTTSPQWEKSSHCMNTRPSLFHQKNRVISTNAAKPGVSTRSRKVRFSRMRK